MGLCPVVDNSGREGLYVQSAKMGSASRRAFVFSILGIFGLCSDPSNSMGRGVYFRLRRGEYATALRSGAGYEGAAHLHLAFAFARQAPESLRVHTAQQNRLEYRRGYRSTLLAQRQ